MGHAKKLDAVQLRWRKLTMNPRASLKLRLQALAKLEYPSDRFLCQLLKKCSQPRLEFAVTELLEKIRSADRERKQAEAQAEQFLANVERKNNG